jgi:hypothetical protein
MTSRPFLNPQPLTQNTLNPGFIFFQAGHVCWDDQDLIEGRPTGAVRVSFGYMSTVEDAQAVIRFVKDYFVVSEPIRGLSFGAQSDDEAGTLLLAFVEPKGVLYRAPVAPAIVLKTKKEMSGIGIQGLKTRLGWMVQAALLSAGMVVKEVSRRFHETYCAHVHNRSKTEGSKEARGNDKLPLLVLFYW